MIKCPKGCDAKIFHNKGISKTTGNPYENYKCAECGHVEWVSQFAKKENTGTPIVVDEVSLLKKEMNDRFDKLGKYLQGKLGE